MKYKIVIKKDFGKYGWYDSETRSNKRLGFVVVKGGCNVIPGAGWFKNIPQALLGVRIHSITGDTMDFHTMWRHIQDGNTLGM